MKFTVADSSGSLGVVAALVFLVGLATAAPATNDIIPEGSPAYNDLLQQQRTWDKQLRLQSIQDYVLSTLGRGKAPTIPAGSPLLGGQQQQPQAPQATSFSGEIKTFYASCDVPSRVDDGVWTDPAYFHLFFKFPGRNGTLNNGSDPLPRKPFTTISAKLKIFKLGESARLGRSSEEESNETTRLDQAVVTTRPVSVTSLLPGGEAAPLVEEKIRVSVYWYKAPVTKTHYKKKLLDTRMISVKGSKWVEFDIINAAVPWLERNDKNYGIVVEVENEDNDPLNPADYFANLACPTRNNSNSSQMFRLAPSPQIEVCILNTPHTQREIDTTESPVPYPLQMSQSFSLLSRMAKAHEQRAANQNTNNNGSEWQNDDLPPTTRLTATPRTPVRNTHKHRHGHGASKNKKHQRTHGADTASASSSPPTASTTGGFQLDEDHPLRRILATVATNVHSREAASRRHHHVPLVGDHSSSEDSSEGDEDRDIIIQKIYIRGGRDSEQQQDR
ncbi:uncharacterized protein LOC110861537 isoform X2 [Folsomia candida]|uniref:uncharacterized protein LOC110861537 isoform X2 n=1 Tax=Folsomia candida TaxID=158441 RepID=UPI000B8F820F|nr:uncharacterized protein LOC110861537 isoform X2 [Folsomia candida]